jgi:flagellar basal body-associated protein FliL
MEPQEIKKGTSVVLVSILVGVLLALLAGGGTWYVMDQKVKKNDDKITDLQNQVDKLTKENKEAAKVTPTPTPTLTPMPTSNQLATTVTSSSEVAKNFCLTEARKQSASASIQDFVYQENSNGSFIKCAMFLNPTGYVLIGKNINNVWAQVHAGQQPPSQDIIDKYKIPTSF